MTDWLLAGTVLAAAGVLGWLVAWDTLRELREAFRRERLADQRRARMDEDRAWTLRHIEYARAIAFTLTNAHVESAEELAALLPERPHLEVIG